MKTFPAALQALLESESTTLCLCWKLTRKDGQVLGFTDHDADIAFDGVTYRAASGMAASDAAESLGLAVDNAEIAGALSSADLREADIAAGLYDDARLEVFLVDWMNPATRQLLHTGSIGRIKRGEVHFEAEFRGLSHYLAQVKGRVYSRLCDAVLGDARCKVDLNAAAYRATGQIDAVVDERTFTVNAVGGFADGFFSGGVLTFSSGVNAGYQAEVKHHAGDTLILWRPPPATPAVGDSVIVTAGCDKRFATCRDKFANAVNFRGFPHMPGNDLVTRYPNRDDGGHDGAPLVTD
ncbi:MAG TPA: DUF2163 domain-containing protein [Thermopetrobacter sp.]|nr:DUF2163 domain-containing protein [Thermopetrobacter sp.]